jgi:hypothetical protein
MATDMETGSEKLAAFKPGQHGRRSSDPEQTAVERETKDNIVDWDGPDDPQNPLNWPAWKRMTQVVLASAFLLTAYGISYAPLAKQTAY